MGLGGEQDVPGAAERPQGAGLRGVGGEQGGNRGAADGAGGGGSTHGWGGGKTINMGAPMGGGGENP